MTMTNNSNSNSNTNVLKALANLKMVSNFSLPAHYGSANRMNSMGIALEYFIKDAFCGSLGLRSVADKEREYSRYLSYVGNANNPPDFMIRGGDAVEVKKIGSHNSGLALNSSYPKNKLHKDNPLITDACRECEEWETRDIIYAVGVVRRSRIESLWFVYGDCYAADKDVYERTRDKIISGINSIEGIEFSRTKELGRVNRVDPLGITYLRIRGMWGIENPMKVFNYLGTTSQAPAIVALMRKGKYLSFPEADRRVLESQNLVSDIQIKNPDNPAAYLDAKIIKL